MKEKFYKINLSKLPENYKKELLEIKSDTEDFGDPDLVSIEQDNFNMLYSKIEKGYPDAIGGSAPKKKAPAKKVKKVVKLDKSAKFKVGDWVMAKAFSSNAKGEVYDVVKSGSSFDYKLKDQYGNKDEKLFAESLLKKTTAPQKAPVTKSTNEIEGCKEVLEKAKYKVVKIKSSDGKKTLTSKKKRQDRTIIKDRVESTFIPIEKDISGSKEKDDKFKEAQKYVTIIKNALTMIMQGIDKLANDNNVEALGKIAGLFQKMIGEKVLKMEKGGVIGQRVKVLGRHEKGDSTFSNKVGKIVDTHNVVGMGFAYKVEIDGEVHDQIDPKLIVPIKRTKLQISQDNYRSEVDKYNWYVIELKTNKVLSGYEYKEDAEEFRLDFDINEKGKDAKEHKTVSKRTLKQMGIEIPNEKWKKMGKGGFLKGSKFYLIHTYLDGSELKEKVIGRDYTTDKFIKFQSDKKLQARKDTSLLGYYLLDPKTLETWHLKPMATGNYKVGEILSKFKQGGKVRDLGRDMRFLSKEHHEVRYAPKRKRPFKKYKA
jgi:hypothetical protein